MFKMKSIPSIYDSIATPFYTSYGQRMPSKAYYTLFQRNVPYPCIAIFTWTDKTTAWSLKMHWLPWNSSYPFLVPLRHELSFNSISSNISRHNMLNITEKSCDMSIQLPQKKWWQYFVEATINYRVCLHVWYQILEGKMWTRVVTRDQDVKRWNFS